MKEYLRENPKGVFKVIPQDSSRSGDIEIPEDAEFAAVNDNGFLEFRKGTSYLLDGDWVRGSWDIIDFEKQGAWNVIWKRKTVSKNKPTVNHPKHYVSDPCGVEAIEITSLLPACISNATKYIWREGKKDSSIQELEKALWYINYSIDNNLPSTVSDLTDSMHFEELITKVKKHWSGWKYVFIDAVYWGDQQQMKRAVEGIIFDIKGVQ